MQPVLEIKATALFLPPHPEPMGIERHHFRLPGALFVNVTVKKIAEMLGYLVAELNTHTDVGNAAEQRFEHRLGLVAVAVGGKVGENASELIARDKCATGANHDVVANRKIPERQQLANR